MALRRPPKGPRGGAGTRPDGHLHAASTAVFTATFMDAADADDLDPRERKFLRLLGYALSEQLVEPWEARAKLDRYLATGGTIEGLEPLIAWLEGLGVGGLLGERRA